jgi:hypothetical protein
MKKTEGMNRGRRDGKGEEGYFKFSSSASLCLSLERQYERYKDRLKARGVEILLCFCGTIRSKLRT